jgi:enoyl-CoA hydratase/carnithine racemase
MSAHLLITREDRVLRITLNRPEKRNALNESLCRDLVNTLRDAGQDRGVGCILLDAAGSVFSAGMDLDEALDSKAPERTAIHEQLFTCGLHYPKPIVAAVQGPALGGGLGLLANCHIVIAGQGSQFGLTEIRIGMWPFVIFRSVTLALGERRAVELALTGRIFGTADAVQYGLVHEVTPAFELDDRATATARYLASASQETLQRGLDFVQQSRGLPWDEATRLAAEMRARNFRSPDFTEGVGAFREKRKPVWPSLDNS